MQPKKTPTDQSSERPMGAILKGLGEHLYKMTLGIVGISEMQKWRLKYVIHIPWCQYGLQVITLKLSTGNASRRWSSMVGWKKVTPTDPMPMGVEVHS